MTTNHTDLIRRLYANAQGVELGADGMGWSPDPALYREAADALEAMQDDAARYRWLRDQDHWPACFDSHSAPEPVRGPELDAAIDAARGQG